MFIKINDAYVLSCWPSYPISLVALVTVVTVVTLVAFVALSAQFCSKILILKCIALLAAFLHNMLSEA